MDDTLPFSEREHDEDDSLKYGPLKLRAAAKDGKAHTLLADQFFSPSLLLAERIERGLLPLAGLTVLELGAGAALPSLLAATLPGCPTTIAITDHPDETIISNLRRNVELNRPHFAPTCVVNAIPYIWGESPDPLLQLLNPSTTDTPGYDILILSDLLYFDASHAQLVSSITLLLSRKASSKAYVAAGKYTPPRVCDAFLELAREAGLQSEEHTEETQTEEERVWRGRMPVVGMDLESLAARKANVRWWVLSWVMNA